jgi:hypothetical protein
VNRGCHSDFHSSEESSLAISVEQVWKLCKSRMESRDAIQRYYGDRQLKAQLFTRIDRQNIMAGWQLGRISTFPSHLLLLLVL